MTDDVTIREARRADAEAIALLWQQLLAEQSGRDARVAPAEDAAERWANDYDHWLHDRFRRILVAEAGGRPVGFVTASTWTPPPIYDVAGEVYVYELFVQPEHRGRGTGRRLVEAVRAWAEDLPVRRMRVGVLAANDAGRRFWEEQGARPLSVELTIDLPETPILEDEAKQKAPLGF